MGANFKSPVFIGKVVTLVLGMVILILGLVSHFESRWVKQIPRELDPSYGFGNIKTYKFCGLRNRYALYSVGPCPRISMEHFYISMIIISFILSTLVLIAEFVVDMRFVPYKFIDIGYHGVSAILLLISGILYIVSAVQIDNLLGEKYGFTFPLNLIKYNFRKGEKIAAGVLTIIQSLLYVAMAGLIAKRSVNNSRLNTIDDFSTNLNH